jgi:hypothetical protein
MAATLSTSSSLALLMRTLCTADFGREPLATQEAIVREGFSQECIAAKIFLA